MLIFVYLKYKEVYLKVLYLALFWSALERATSFADYPNLQINYIYNTHLFREVFFILTRLTEV